MANPAPNPDNRLTVDLQAIARNLSALRALLAPGLRVAGVVKADAYGHGLLPVARALKGAGAEALAVASLAEGKRLRRGGVGGPIYLLLGARPAQAAQAAALELTPICGDMEALEALAAAGRGRGTPVPAQVKIDTGMGRLGVNLDEAWEFLQAAASLPGLAITGLVSHLATAGDPASGYARRQAEAFAGLLTQARAAGLDLPDSSLSGSGGALVPLESGLAGRGLVRLGMALYGALPDPAAAGRAELRGAMSLRTRVLALRRAPQGACVSYGRTWQAPHDTWLAVVPLGYGDGYPRAASNQAAMLIGGEEAPIRGRVCMNLTVLEVGGLAQPPRPGQEVVALGRQGGAEISADRLAAWCGVIPYEITCSLGAALPRRYQPRPAAAAIPS